MSLDSEDRKALIAYRQEKADFALDDAAFLTDAGKYGLAANRLYYALYYAATTSYSLSEKAQRPCGGMIYNNV